MLSRFWGYAKVGRSPARPTTAGARIEPSAVQRCEPPTASADPATQTRPSRETALIVGAGRGFGEALARRLAREGLDVVMAARDGPRLEHLAAELRTLGGRAQGIVCDATQELSVNALFKRIHAEYGTPHLVVYALQSSAAGRVLDIGVPAFEEGWRHNCLGAFLVARAAGRLMASAGRGSIVLVGSTAAPSGREDQLNLTVGRFGQRALAQVMARELWPLGVHVVHMARDTDVQAGTPEPCGPARPKDLVDAVVVLYRQPRSAWISEPDFRPWSEHLRGQG